MRKGLLGSRVITKYAHPQPIRKPVSSIFHSSDSVICTFFLHCDLKFSEISRDIFRTMTIFAIDSQGLLFSYIELMIAVQESRELLLANRAVMKPAAGDLRH